MGPADAAPAKPKKKGRPHRRPGTPGAPGSAGSPTTGDEQGWGGGDTIEEVEPQLVTLSAADRALEWRGDDTTRPAQKIDMNGGAETRSLDDNEIRSTIASQSGPVQTCVVQAATNTNLSGTVTVKMVVDGSGRVIKSKLQAPHYMLEHGLLGCVQGALGHMHFPSTGQATLVTLPVNFT
jgi:hypothetical protein